MLDCRGAQANFLLFDSSIIFTRNNLPTSAAVEPILLGNGAGEQVFDLTLGGERARPADGSRTMRIRSRPSSAKMPMASASTRSTYVPETFRLGQTEGEASGLTLNQIAERHVPWRTAS